MRGFLDLLVRFQRDERGVFAVIFGVMAVVLVALSGAVVDYVALEQTRARAQVALDAAALALQPEMYTATRTELMDSAGALMIDRIGDPKVTATMLDAVKDTELGSLSFSAEVEMPTMFVALVGVPTLGARIFSEVTRGSLDVEVAVVVDITGSMTDRVPTGNGGSESKITALKRALNQLIDIVVKDEQTPSYSKMAIVPYSVAVNVGATYAPTIRGPVTPPTNITNINWAVAGSGRNVKHVDGQRNKAVTFTTTSAHGLSVNQIVYVTGTSFSGANNKILEVSSVPSTTTFRLKGITTESDLNSISGGTVTKCGIPSCELVVTSVGHGLATNDYAYIRSTSLRNYSNNDDWDWIDNNTSDSSSRFIAWQIGNATANTFSLPGTAPTNLKNYGTLPGSGGTVSCVVQGCRYYLFTNNEGNARRQEISTCVTERTPNGATDVSPSTTYLGRNYSSGRNPCPSTLIQPLTDDKDILHDLADDLVAAGSTAGHIGIGWGWYLVSPNFQGPWPEESQPAPADEKNVIRAVVIMTDGAFNTSYCNGVISRIAGNGSGGNSDKINCDSPNGNAFTQGQALCDEMNKPGNGIRVYTVAFDVGDIDEAEEIMADCATDADHAYDATSGADLADAFAAIGEALSSLRVTQ